MASRINELRDLYGKLSLTLPEELLDPDLKRQLTENISTFTTIYAEDRATVQSIIKAMNEQKYIPLDKIDQGGFLLNYGLKIDEDGTLKNKRSRAKFLLCHWFMSIYGLKMVLKEIIKELEIVQDYYTRYTTETDAYNKKAAFLTFTRGYQAVTGYAINAGELIEEYEMYYSHACHTIDPSYQARGGSIFSALHPDEILTGAISLFLRGNMGRDSCPPLIRSAVEIALSRKLLDTKGTKYSNKTVIPSKQLDINGLLGAVTAAGIQLPFHKDAIATLYDWGSLSIHLGYRMRTCEIWAAWIAADNISSIENQEIPASAREKIVSRLHSQGKVAFIE